MHVNYSDVIEKYDCVYHKDRFSERVTSTARFVSCGLKDILHCREQRLIKLRSWFMSAAFRSTLQSKPSGKSLM